MTRTRWMLVAALAAVAVALPATVRAGHGPEVRIVSPKRNAQVKSPVTVQAVVDGFTLVAAGTPLKDGEGHLHFFIDVPADNVKPGAMIPMDTTARYVHLGKEPYDKRDLALAPGVHTVTVVAANSGHQRIGEIHPVSVTFTVVP